VLAHCWHRTGRGIRLTAASLDEVDCCYCETTAWWDNLVHAIGGVGPFPAACLPRSGPEPGRRACRARRQRHAALPLVG